MNRKSNDKFIFYLREFFTVYLPKQKNCSPHTIIACQQTWNMLLEYVCDFASKRIESISFIDLNKSTIMSFLDEMERLRDWAPSTRNHRLSCIRSFFKFVSCLEPTLVIHLEELNRIPLKKSINPT